MDLVALFREYGEQIKTFELLLLMVNAVVHVLFAGAVARDAGSLTQIGRRPALVSSPVWAFATLLGGVMVAAVYWFIHHSTLTLGVRDDGNKVTRSPH